MQYITRRKKRLRIAFFSIALSLLLILAAFFIYVGIYYEADEEAISAFAPMDAVDTEVLDGAIAFKPRDTEVRAGLIFYPGGKVESEAYRPLMAALAEQGILSILIDMPFNLAVLDVNAADGYAALFPGVSRWFIGGHSLGGSMAASYLAKHTSEFEGLILLGSYTTADLSQTGLSALSLYGSEDRVMNREKYEKNKMHLPPDFTEQVIEGGCHAYFGMYGAQSGDGTPTLRAEEQILITANVISLFMD